MTNEISAYTKHDCVYYIVWAPKYRRKVMRGHIKPHFLRGGATLAVDPQLCVLEIQTHVPREGERPPAVFVQPGDAAIQTHAPREGERPLHITPFSLINTISCISMRDLFALWICIISPVVLKPVRTFRHIYESHPFAPRLLGCGRITMSETLRDRTTPSSRNARSSRDSCCPYCKSAGCLFLGRSIPGARV